MGEIEQEIWVVVCQSPYEIEYHLDGECIGTATGFGATELMRKQKKRQKKKLKNLEFKNR